MKQKTVSMLELSVTERLVADVKVNITKAQEKQKKYYDSKHGAASCFNVGSIVLKKDFRRKKCKGPR